jgi:hypothetical protein
LSEGDLRELSENIGIRIGQYRTLPLNPAGRDERGKLCGDINRDIVKFNGMVPRAQMSRTHFSCEDLWLNVFDADFYARVERHRYESAIPELLAIERAIEALRGAQSGAQEMACTVLQGLIDAFNTKYNDMDNIGYEHGACRAGNLPEEIVEVTAADVDVLVREAYDMEARNLFNEIVRITRIMDNLASQARTDQVVTNAPEQRNIFSGIFRRDRNASATVSSEGAARELAGLDVDGRRRVVFAGALHTIKDGWDPAKSELNRLRECARGINNTNIQNAIAEGDRFISAGGNAAPLNFDFYNFGAYPENIGSDTRRVDLLNQIIDNNRQLATLLPNCSAPADQVTEQTNPAIQVDRTGIEVADIQTLIDAADTMQPGSSNIDFVQLAKDAIAERYPNIAAEWDCEEDSSHTEQGQAFNCTAAAGNLHHGVRVLFDISGNPAVSDIRTSGGALEVSQDNEQQGPVSLGSVLIEGVPRVGGTLGAVLMGFSNGITPTYSWSRLDGFGNETQIGTNSSTYIVAREDAGYRISVTVSADGAESISYMGPWIPSIEGI